MNKEKTIFLITNNRKAAIANRIVILLASISFIVSGTIRIIEPVNSKWDAVLAISMLTIGVIYLIMSYVVFSKHPKLARRIAFNENGMAYKVNLFKPLQNISWDKISQIELRPYRINLFLGKEKKTVSYVAPYDVSIDIKKTVREFAGFRNITVVGG
ncbi:MAG: hypothetical protein AAFX87_29615 [Bacteroidota bacterium]